MISLIEVIPRNNICSYPLAYRSLHCGWYSYHAVRLRLEVAQEAAICIVFLLGYPSHVSRRNTSNNCVGRENPLIPIFRQSRMKTVLNLFFTIHRRRLFSSLKRSQMGKCTLGGMRALDFARRNEKPLLDFWQFCTNAILY